MRRTVLVAVALACAAEPPAHAVKIVVKPVISRCRERPSWPAVEKCLTDVGIKPIAVVRELRGAKLVQSSRGERPGIYLYVERGGKWNLAGMYESGQSELQVLSAGPFTIAKHTGYRIDVGVVARDDIVPDGVTLVPAVVRKELSLFCNGESYYCTDVMTSCDTIVRGQAMWTFHGKLSITERTVRVAGDRRLAGTLCEVAEENPLDWPEP